MSALPSEARSNPPEGEDRLALAADLSRYALLVMSLYFVATFVIAAVVRLSHPFALDWVEGGVVEHVARVVDGEPIFVAPSIDFVADRLTPLYYWLAAGLAVVTGVGFLPLRLVSLMASLGCLFVLFRFVERETGDRYAALAAAGFYAATYPLTGEWLDLGRGDSLALFFVLLGAYRLRGAHGARDRVLAAVCSTAAFFTDPVTAVVAAPLGLYDAVSTKGAMRFAFTATTALLIAAGSGLASWWSDGWFSFYAFEMPLSQLTAGVDRTPELFGAAPIASWSEALAGALPLPSLLAVAVMVTWAGTRRGSELFFFLLLSFGLSTASWLSHGPLGGDAPAMMPAYALMALLAGLSLHALPAWAERTAGGDAAGGARRLRVVALGLRAVCIVQLAALYYDPGEAMPGDVDRAEGELMLALLAQIDGEVLSPVHGHLARVAGKTPSAHALAIDQVIRAGGPEAARLTADVVDALASGRYAAVFGGAPGFSKELIDHYAVSRMGAAPADLVYPRGPRVARTRDVFLPRIE